MFDLLNLRRAVAKKGENSSVAAPQIVALVTPASIGMDEAKGLMITHGFSVSQSHPEADGSVIFKQAPELPDDYSVFRVSDNLLALVTGFDAEGAVAGTCLEGVLKAEEWYPSAELAIQIGAAAAASHAENGTLTVTQKTEQVSLVSKGINEYLGKLFAWVPARLTELARDLEAQINANKIQPATDASLRGVPVATPTGAPASEVDTGGAKGVTAAGTPAPSEFSTNIDTGARENAPAKVAKGEGPDGTPVTADPAVADPASAGATVDTPDVLSAALAGMVSKMEKMLSDSNAANAAAIAALTGTVTALKSDLDTIRKTSEVTADRANEASRVAKSLSDRVAGTLVMSDQGEQLVSGVRKSDEPEAAGLIDTAFGRPARRNRP